MRSSHKVYLEEYPLWYKDAVIYELHVRAFYDSNDDGIGDFQGLTQKLGHLESIGVTAIWLLPFYPSPLKDDGYDIANYFDIHPDYGTLRDFKEFLKEAHRRGIRVITEIVLNHTSDQHEWFQKARRAKPGSRWRNFYVWDSPERYKDARIIFKDFETSNWSWDPVARSYYWHRFYSHQPDLNYDNPQVQKMMLKVIDYWLDMGVDGLRLDAVPYLYEREGTNCENLPETYEFLRKLRAHVDSRHKDKMLLAEANQWPEDAVNYLGNGDLCHMAFHFPLMPRMFMAIRMENRYPVMEILDQTPSIPDTCQWALFLRNHDELTLEMVTDEERDYMYRIYAKERAARINLGIRRRLAPLLENDRRKIELMNFLLLSLPGTPVIYYGDEIGMGDNYYLGDRNGVRTPMQWSSDRNAGFSRANPQKLYLPVIIDPEYHCETLNVENQCRSEASLLWWMKHFIAMRNRFKAFGRGTIEILLPENTKILAFVRQYRQANPVQANLVQANLVQANPVQANPVEENILVVVNLSRHPQLVELELSKFSGCVPEEVFSGNAFIPIKNSLYALTLGSYGYYLFLLKKPEESGTGQAPQILMEIQVSKRWEMVLTGKAREKLEQEILPPFLQCSRWFGGKARRIEKIDIARAIPIGKNSSATRDACTYLLFLEVKYTEGASETYLLPLAFAVEDQAEKIMEEYPQSVVARLEVNEQTGAPGTGEPGTGEPGTGEPGKGEPGKGEPGKGEPGKGEPGKGAPGKGAPGKGAPGKGIIYDGIYNEKFRQDLLMMILKRHKVKENEGELAAYPGKVLRRLIKEKDSLPESHVLKGEQSNSAILYGNKLFLKLFRRLEEGTNSELEILWFLTEKLSYSQTRCACVPAFAGVVEYRHRRTESVIIAMLQSFVPNEGDAWTYTLDAVARYFSSVLSRLDEVKEVPVAPSSFLDIADQQVPPLIQDLLSDYLEMASLLGKRTAELHLALSSDQETPYFAPEPFSLLYQRSVYQSQQSAAMRTFRLLEKNLVNLPEKERSQAEEVLTFQKSIMNQLKAILRKKFSAMIIRIHGDYHLGQVLYTGKDFVIIDFEGEPARALSERRLKRSPMRDVAGMIRSFHYAAYTALLKKAPVRPEDIDVLEPWADLWYKYTAGTFLKSYLDTTRDAPFIPRDREELEVLLKAFILDKAIYEVGYELNNRPEWLTIPLKGIKYLMEEN